MASDESGGAGRSGESSTAVTSKSIGQLVRRWFGDPTHRNKTILVEAFKSLVREVQRGDPFSFVPDDVYAHIREQLFLVLLASSRGQVSKSEAQLVVEQLAERLSLVPSVGSRSKGSPIHYWGRTRPVVVVAGGGVSYRINAPVGLICLICHSRFTADSTGFIDHVPGETWPLEVGIHRECELYRTEGSSEHQRRTCGCEGSTGGALDKCPCTDTYPSLADSIGAYQTFCLISEEERLVRESNAEWVRQLRNRNKRFS